MSHEFIKENTIKKICCSNLEVTQDLEGFMSSKEVLNDLHSMMKIVFVGVGQGGGKITVEFIRFNFYSKLINTSSKDLENAEAIIKTLKDIQYDKLNKLKLEGYEGASKSREIGLMAAQDNQQQIVSFFQEDEELIDADFVFVVGALGGGTACGSIDIIAKVISALRQHKKTKDGRPTTGTITAMPEADAQEQIQLNAAQAIKEIQLLQSQGILGTCLLIDNEKMIEEFLKSDNKKYIDWTELGNQTVARLITEICGITCLNSNETLDKSELFDVWASPTFMTIGKLKYDIKKFCEMDTDEIIKKLNETNLFADVCEKELAQNCCFAMVIPENKDCVKQVLKFKRSANEFYSKSLVEKIHFATGFSRIFGSFKNPITEDNKSQQAILYSVIGYGHLPQRIFEATEKALKQQEERKAIELEKEKESLKLTEMLKEVEHKDISIRKEQTVTLTDLFTRSSDEKQDELNSKNNSNDFGELFKR